MKQILSVLIACCMFATLFTGCQSASSSGSSAGGSGDIVLGVFEPLTGDYAAGGEQNMEGFQLANELYPQALGRNIKLSVADNKSDKAEAANVVARLIDQDHVVAILGSWGSSLSMAAGNIVQEKKVPAVAADASNPQVTLGNAYYFRACFIDPFQGTVMAQYALDKLGAKTACLVQEASNDYSVGLAKYFADAFKAKTGNNDCILATENYQTGDKDFSAQLTDIKAKNPDVVFAPGAYTESALLMKQARKLGITCPFLGGDTWENQAFLDVGGADVEGATFSTFFAKEKTLTDEAAKFLDAYAKKYPGKEPSASAVLAYDAYLMVYSAINACGSADPQKIRDAIAATKDLKGASGVITLDNKGGDPIKDAFIKTVKDGKFAYLDYIPASSVQ